MKDEDRKAFERFCRTEHGRLVRTAWAITGDWQEAMDLGQEALIRVYTRWGTVSSLDMPSAWAHRVVANLALSWRRRQRRRSRVVMPEPVQGPAEPPDSLLLEALRALPPHQRAVVVLRYYADLSINETARALRKRPGTVRALASQGLARLREALGAQEIESESRD